MNPSFPGFQQHQDPIKVKVAKLQSLRRIFENLQINESKSIDQFISQVMIIVNQIRSIQEEITDQKVIENTLRSFPSQFDTIVVAIEESKDLA